MPKESLTYELKMTNGKRIFFNFKFIFNINQKLMFYNS